MNRTHLSRITLFAAAIVGVTQITVLLLKVGFPFLLLLLMFKVGFDQKMQAFIHQQASFLKPEIILMNAIGVIFLGVISAIFYVASRNIKKHHQVKTWAITALVAAVIMINFSNLAGVLGVIGAVAGLMALEEKDN